MTIQAQLPDGRILEFPDGTDPAIIQTTVKRVLGVEQQQAQIQPETQAESIQPQPITHSRGGQPQPIISPPEQPELEGFTGSSFLEPLATVGTSAIAQPVSGFVGLGTLAFGGSLKEAADNISSTQEALTFQPKTEAGKEGLKTLSKVVETGIDLANIPASGIAGITELIAGQGLDQASATIESVQTKGLSQTLADRVLEETGSPVAATIAQTSPDFALELIGLKGLSAAKLAKAKLSSNVAGAITDAAPDLKTIKDATKAAYTELDNSGIKVKPNVYDKFADNLQSRLSKEGLKLDSPSEQLFPKSSSALKTILDDKGTPKTLSELETLRRVAKGAADSIDKPDSRLGSIIVNEIDNSLDKLSNQIGGKFKEARGLAQRAFKSQAITDMIENASHTASGLENGLRIEARKLLKSPKKRRGFTKDEIDALKQIEQGTTASNAAKFLGKFGISEGQATSMLGASIGIGGGGAIGSAFGPVGAATGALAIPALGQIAKRTAQKITLGNTKFADDLARSGKNAKGVVRAYLKHTPIKDRNVSDLTDLLMDNNLNIDTIKTLPKSKTATNKLVSDAVFFANEIKRKAQQAGSAGLVAQPELQQEE